MFESRKTVASVQATFTTMITDLEVIQIREETAADIFREKMLASETEASAAAAFKQGLGKLLAGQ